MQSRVAARLEAALTNIEAIVAVGGLVLMLLLTLVQVVARNFFDTGYPVADTLVRYLVLLVSFSGAILAIREGRHIKIDVATGWMPPAWSNAILRLCNLLGMAVCGVFTWAAAKFWWMEWQFSPHDERWIALLALVLPVGFGLLALHFLLRLYVRGAWPHVPGA